jgi:uncharacterized glyoxalase superfamily metalloenzyme YdcJ
VPRPGSACELVSDGVLEAVPIVYEDFLPRSAAGIFQSNLTADGNRDDRIAGTVRDAAWLSDVIGAAVADPAELYAAQQRSSIQALPLAVRDALRLAPGGSEPLVARAGAPTG